MQAEGYAPPPSTWPSGMSALIYKVLNAANLSTASWTRSSLEPHSSPKARAQHPLTYVGGRAPDARSAAHSRSTPDE